MRRLVLSCLLLVSTFLSAAEVAIPNLTARVNDYANLLDAGSKAQLEERLIGLETRKGAQLVLLTLPTTGDSSIEAFAVKTFETWQLGRKQIDDGVLILIASEDRAMRIEVGYGLEGAITDVAAARIIREFMIPELANGNYAQALEQGIVQLEHLIDGEPLPEPKHAEQPVEDDSSLILVLSAFALFFGRAGVLKKLIGSAVLSAVALPVALFFGQSLSAALLSMVMVFFGALFFSLIGSGKFVGTGGGGFGGGGGLGGGGGGGSSGGGGASGRW